MFITDVVLICFEKHMNDEILNLIKEARDSLGSFCINECKSLCCKKGSLVLFNNYEIEIIASPRIEEYFENGILKASSSGNVLYDLKRAPCQHLGDDYYCKIWKEKNRPIVCQDFPLFVKGDYVITGDMCPAIKKGILNDYLDRLRKLGLKII